MHLNLIFQDRSITIHLFANLTVKKWFYYFKGISNWYKCNFFPDNSFKAFDTIKKSINPEFEWRNIKSAINLLENLGFQFPVDLPKEFDKNQKTLNYLHRFFTYNILWYHDNKKNPCLNPYDNNFKLDETMSFQQWLDILDEINQSVHRLESYAIPQDNLKFIRNTFPLCFYNLIPTRTTTDLTTWLDFDDFDKNNNYKYFDYFNEIDHDNQLILLNESILGKSVLQSFSDEDDVNARDCTGRLGSFGGFIIDLNQNRNKIYQSEKFKKWAHRQQCRVNLLPLEFPIGYLKNISLHRDYLLNNHHKFEKVEFVES